MRTEVEKDGCLTTSADRGLDRQQVPPQVVLSLRCPHSNHFCPAVTPKADRFLSFLGQKLDNNQKIAQFRFNSFFEAAISSLQLSTLVCPTVWVHKCTLTLTPRFLPASRSRSNSR